MDDGFDLGRGCCIGYEVIFLMAIHTALGQAFTLVGYPSIYGNATIMKWNQRSQPPSARLPKLGLIIRATTPSFWRGFRMMLPALTTLTGSAGKTDLHAHRATASKAGA